MNFSAACLGLALTLITLGNIPPYVFLMVGMVSGLFAASRCEAVKTSFQIAVRNPFTWGLIGFVGWMMLTSTLGINPEYSLRKVQLLALFLLCGFGLFHVFRTMDSVQHTRVIEWMVNGVLASYILIVLLFALEPWLLSVGAYEPNDVWTVTRLRFYSSALAVILPLCWMFWLQDGKGGYALTKKAMALIVVSMLATLICTGRAGWIGLAVGGTFFGVMMMRYHGLRFNWRLIVGGLGAFAVVGTLAYVCVFGVASLGERVGLIIPDRGLGGGRLDIWAMALQGIQDHPLLGIGLNAFRFLPGADFHPHNFVLQIALEGGLPALVLVAAMIVGTMIFWWRGAKVNPLMTALFAGFISYLVCALTNRSVFNPEWMIYLMFVASFGASVMSATAAGKVRKK